jgi:hypothetical protein
MTNLQTECIILVPSIVKRNQMIWMCKSGNINKNAAVDDLAIEMQKPIEYVIILEFNTSLRPKEVGPSVFTSVWTFSGMKILQYAFQCPRTLRS